MQITEKDLIKYYISKLERTGQIRNEFEKQNEQSYWNRIRKHQHIFIKINGELYCIGCPLASIYKDDSDDKSYIFQELYNNTMKSKKYSYVSQENIDSYEAEALYDIYKYLPQEELVKTLKLKLTKKETK